MVPEGHCHLVGGVILIGKSKELIEGLGVAHIGGILLLDELQPLAVVEPPLKFFRIHLVVLPHGGAAGLDDHIDVFGQMHLHHLGKVGGGEAAVGLKIAAAQIPVHRPASVPGVKNGGGIRGGPIRSLVPAAGGEGKAHNRRQKKYEYFVLHPCLHFRSPEAAASWPQILPPSAHPHPAGPCTSESHSQHPPAPPDRSARSALRRRN